MRRIAVINQKGGCGKTTTAINLAGVFAARSLRTLLVDMDPQSHCAAGLAIPEQRIDLDIGDAMMHAAPERLDPARLLWRITRNLDLAPSRMKLAGIEAARSGLGELPDKHTRLGRLFEVLLKDYEICCIDCPPSIGLLTFNALTAASEVLIPVETSYFSLQGAAKQVATIKSLGKRLGTRADYWLVPTIHDESSALAKDLLEELRRRFGERLAPVVIRYDSALKEAASFGQPVIEYNSTSRGCEDYLALAQWLLDRPGAQRIESPSHTAECQDSPTVMVAPPEQAEHAMAARLATPKPEPSVGPTIESAIGSAEAPGLVQSCIDSTRPTANTAALKPRPKHGVASARGVDHRRALAVASSLTRLTPARETRTLQADLPESDETPSSPRPPYGVMIEGNSVTFVQPLGSGGRIAIAGDFNGWSPQAHVMHRDSRRGIFQLRVPLAPGRRHYRLVVDGRWSHDPHNSHSELSPFGEQISIVDVMPKIATIETIPRCVAAQPAD